MTKRDEKIIEYKKYTPKGNEKSMPIMANWVQRNRIK